MNHHFQLPASYKKWTYALIGAGIIALLYGFIVFHPFDKSVNGDHVNATRFWAVLLQNGVYWLLVVNAAMFFMCVTTMAMGSWQVAFRRVTEAISAVVPIIGVITFVILMALVWGGRADIYPWLDKNVVAHDEILKGKSGFLSREFFTIWSAATVLLWWLLGKKMRSLSLKTDR